jgi:hypothetical protein
MGGSARWLLLLAAPPPEVEVEVGGGEGREVAEEEAPAVVAEAGGDAEGGGELPDAPLFPPVRCRGDRLGDCK